MTTVGPLAHVPRWLRTTFLIWLVWVVILIAFQYIVTARFQPARPDEVLFWTATETTADAQDDQPYLVHPFMNAQVSWDSEFYLSIALTGYDDPLIRTAPPPWHPDHGSIEPVSLNYAFFPLYPWLTRIVSFPLRLLMSSPLSAVTLAGVLVSILGTLSGMIALADLVRGTGGDDHEGWRAAFYLLIFPAGFFLAMVYTEGLFVGLAFGSLALLRRDRWLWAALLAGLATLTRAVGVALLLPMLLAWVQSMNREQMLSAESLRTHGPRLLLALMPLAALGLWWVMFGAQFNLVEETFFGRGAFELEKSLTGWLGAIEASLAQPETAVYYALEIGLTLLALVACFVTLRQYPGLSLFGLAAIIIAVTSASPQSMIRYVLVVPSLFIMLARLGRHEAFDRGWTLASILLMGMLAALFAFDLWVA